MYVSMSVYQCVRWLASPEEVLQRYDVPVEAAHLRHVDRVRDVVQNEGVDIVVPFQHLEDGFLSGFEIASEHSMFDLETEFGFEEVPGPTLFIKLQLLRPGLDPLQREVRGGEPGGQVQSLVEVVNVEIGARDVRQAFNEALRLGG